MVLYTFTCKFVSKNMKNCVPSDYGLVWTWWRKYKIVPLKVRYEQDSKGVCHAHGLVKTPDNFLVKKISKIPGIHMRFDVCYDVQGWLEYINKTCCKPTAICIHDDNCLMQRLSRPLWRTI